MENHSKRGITRPSAAHLTLPLVNRHSRAYNGPSSDDSEDNNLLTVPSSRWTLSAVPKSSASTYSQGSYIGSPPVFSERTVDRRRFALTISPSAHGSWFHAAQPRSPHVTSANTFMIDLKSATVESFPDEASTLTPKEVLQEKRGDVKGTDEKEVHTDKKWVKEKEDHVEQVLPKQNSNRNLKKLRVSVKVIGKLLSRFSGHHRPNTSKPVDVEEEEESLLSVPPQILITLPSPGFQLPSALPRGTDVSKDIALTTSSEAPKKRSTFPSTWKPRRPPSPLPRMLRKRSKRKDKRYAMSFSPLIDHSSPPPLPTRTSVALPVRREWPEAGFASFSMPLRSAAVQSQQDTPSWDDLQRRLKARALKSATYAVHDGGIISPTPSSLL